MNTTFGDILSLLNEKLPITNSPHSKNDKQIFFIDPATNQPFSNDKFTASSNNKKTFNEDIFYKNFLSGIQICDLPNLNESYKNSNMNATQVVGSSMNKDKINFKNKTKTNVVRKTRKGRYNANYYQHFYENINNNDEHLEQREFSINISESFGEPLEMLDFADLKECYISKDYLQDILNPTDILWTGNLSSCDRSLENITPKNIKELPEDSKIASEAFKLDSITDDFIMQQKANDGIANIFISDLHFATIAMSTRSILSWDILIRKQGNQLFFFQRNDSEVHHEFVRENSKDSNEELKKCSAEATLVNAMFRQIFVNQKNSVDLTERNSAQNEHNETFKISLDKNKAFRYRLFTMSGSLKVLMRCSLDAFSPSKNTNQLNFVKINAFTEFKPLSSTNGWRRKLEIQKGGVLADQTQLNNFQVARWAVQGLVSGCKELRFGFVSRKSNQPPLRHVLQGTAKESLANLTVQMGIKTNSFWGVFKKICEILLRQPEDGEFVLVKDPKAPLLMVFKKPFY